MTNRVEFSPETVRMAQLRARANGVELTMELARLAVEELVIMAEPELELLLQPELALSSVDSLQTVLKVNDVVVNGLMLDVRALDSEGRLSLRKSLIGTPVLANGSVVVRVNGSGSADLVGHLPKERWSQAERTARGEDVALQFEEDGSSFDIIDFLSNLSAVTLELSVQSDAGVSEVELRELLNNRRSLPLTRQRQIVSALATSPRLRSAAEELKLNLSPQRIESVLKAESKWNRRTEEMVNVLSDKLKSVSKENLAGHIRKTGEFYGGQTDAPAFRKAVLSRLADEKLAERVGAGFLKRARNMAEIMLRGATVRDAVKDLISNGAAVDIAFAIKERRPSANQAKAFMQATAEEIGQAFASLALQPSYATHSNKDAGMDSINEALELLEAGDMVSEIMDLEKHLVEG